MKRAGAAIIAGVVAVGGVATTADAKHVKKNAGSPTVQSAKVDVYVGGLVHMVWSGARVSSQPATSAKGAFTGTIEYDDSVPPLGAFTGPVTCLEVKGNRAGMFYPVTGSVPPGANQAIKGVYISIETNSKGAATKAGFTPSLSATTDSCSPDANPPVLPASGTAFVSGG